MLANECGTDWLSAAISLTQDGMDTFGKCHTCSTPPLGLTVPSVVLWRKIVERFRYLVTFLLQVIDGVALRPQAECKVN